MDEKELKALTEKLDKQYGDLTKAIEAKADADSLVKAQEELRKDLSKCADKEYAEKMQEQLDLHETKIADRVFSDGYHTKSEDEQLYDMFKGEKFEAFKNEKNNRISFDVKASTISTANSFTETNSRIIVAQRDPVIGIDPRRPFALTNLVSKGVINQSDQLDWIERTAETTGTAMKAEGTAYGQSDVSWTSYILPVRKATDYIKVTREKLSDTDFIRSEILDVLNYNIPHLIENNMWTGDGTNQALYGLLGGGAYNAAKTFALPSGVESVTQANEYDVLSAAILQVELGDTTNTKATGFLCDAIFVHPADYYNMTRLKDSNNQYLMGMDGVMRIDGVPIYKTQRITAGTYLVADTKMAKLYQRQATQVEMWDQNDTDAISGLVTITATSRVVFQVKNVNTFAFVTGTFEAGKGLLG
jgi:HK97 family phage major capsid protein